MMTALDDRPSPQQLTLTALFLKFLRFGALAFGGPVAQIAMIRQALVEDERWIDPSHFKRLLAVLQILPGPEAHELCVHLGMIARGRIGGLLAGLGFMLPGFALMLAMGWGYTRWISGNPELANILLGVQVVVLAIILRAVVRIGQHMIEDAWLGAIALVSLVATFAGVPFWLPLLVGGIFYALLRRPLLASMTVATGVLAAMAIQSPAVADGIGPFSSKVPVTIWMLFVTGLKGGLLTFGGAYTAIPYIRADAVGRGWINDATFLDGVALAGILPAPLVIFATFIGYVAGGPAGAIAITVGMFLPAFAFSLILFERLEAIVENPALHHVLSGVAAAVVGTIAATFFQLGAETFTRISQPVVPMMTFLIALLVAWRVKGGWVSPALIFAGAAVAFIRQTS